MADTRYRTEKTGTPGVYKLLKTDTDEWVSTRVMYRDAAGKQVVKTFHGANTLTAAKRWKGENVKFRDTSGRPDIVAGKKKLRAVYDEMVAHAEAEGHPYADATLSLHGDAWNALGKIDPKLEATEVGRLTPARIDKTLSQIMGKSTGMRQKARAMLQRTGSFAVARGYISANFVQKTFQPRTRAARMARSQLEAKPEKMPSTEEVTRLTAAMPERYRALVLVMAFEGLRPGEAFGLKVGDLDFESGTITIRRSFSKGQVTETKTGQTRVLPMVPAPAMAETLKLHLERYGSADDPDAWVFTGETGSPIDSHNWSQRIFATAAEKAKVNGGISPNQLRHHAASFWITKGAHVLQVSKLLGHSTPTVTLDVYAGLFKDELFQLVTLGGAEKLPALGSGH
jgi:integrase